MINIINRVISVCTIKDLQTWIYSSSQITKYIKAEKYEVIVPSIYVDIFKKISPAVWVVSDEKLISPEFDINYIEKRMPLGQKSRAGWYYQQLLKIRAAIGDENLEHKILIFDADTIPLKEIIFFQNDKPAYFYGPENHSPYFVTIKKLLGYQKNVNFSFIAQCFPCYSSWVLKFKQHIEILHKKPWFDAILDCTDLSESSGFSEYESLGTYFTHNFQDAMMLNDAKWERFGEKFCTLEKVTQDANMSLKFAFVAYESWNKRSYDTVTVIESCKNENEFYDLFFNMFTKKRKIIQVGANDGVMCDPLHRYLISSVYDDVSVVLIEPLEFYFNKLKKLHSSRLRTTLLKVAAGSVEGIQDFYFIDPNVAAEMNGDGPLNDWAHGQGSFFKESIIHWIHQNSFRGVMYKKNINRYINSIIKTSLTVLPLRNICCTGSCISTLVIDVQGAELEVLLGVDWTSAPDFIVYEQDITKIKIIDDFLLSLGYAYMCGKDNIVLYNTKTIVLSA
jgi:FkbM family methyltransferase